MKLMMKPGASVPTGSGRSHPEAIGFPGCVIRARLIGAIEARQKAKHDAWQRNDRLIAVALYAETHQEIHTLSQLRPCLLAEIKELFVDYNRLRDRRFKPLADSGPKEARKLVEAGMKMFKRGRRRAH